MWHIVVPVDRLTAVDCHRHPWPTVDLHLNPGDGRPWVAHGRTPSGEDAEVPGGRRHAMLAEAARKAGIAVVGGAITIDAHTGIRHNREES